MLCVLRAVLTQVIAEAWAMSIQPSFYRVVETNPGGRKEYERHSVCLMWLLLPFVGWSKQKH